MSKLVCNVCHFDVDGIAFRTTCCHFYCPKCAKQTFQNSSQCTICGTSLTEKCVKEVTSTSWDHIRVQLQRVQMGYQELTDFVTNQLVLVSIQSLQQRNEFERMCELQAAELNNANRRLTELELQRDDIVSSYDQKLRDSNRALAEIQEAYKEKLRKCQAWEKAYNNVRSQLSEGKGFSERVAVDEATIMQREEGRLPLPSSALAVQQDSRYNPQAMRNAESTTFRSVVHHRMPMPPEVTPQAHVQPQAALPRYDALYPSWRQYDVMRQHQQPHLGPTVSSSVVPYEQSAQSMTSRSYLDSHPHPHRYALPAVPPPLHSEYGVDTGIRSPGNLSPTAASSSALPVGRHHQQHQQHHQQQQRVDGWSRGEVRQQAALATTSAQAAPKRSFFDTK